MKCYNVKFTRTITSVPETEIIIAISRERARDIFLMRNPTFYVVSVERVPCL